MNRIGASAFAAIIAQVELEPAVFRLVATLSRTDAVFSFSLRAVDTPA